MFNKLSHFSDYIKDWYNPVEYDLKPYEKILQEINKYDFTSLKDEELIDISCKIKSGITNGESMDQQLPEAFALVREVSRRVLGLYPFDVQTIAGIALHKGKVVEMKTGEGKTSAAVMPAYLNALSGKGVHVLTFNDYLAQRDSQWMGPIYEFLGLKVSYIKEGMTWDQRKKAYASDITYLTAKEAGFDYLRDFLCMDKNKLVHRPFYYAIVDEADSIMIDEARIPLVIAGNEEVNMKRIEYYNSIVNMLIDGVDYEIDEHGRNIFLTESGLAKVEEIMRCGNLYDSENLEKLTRINCAFHAEKLLKKDRDYIVRNGRVEIIDEFTWRIADKRHWPDNL